jgi:hypothetical protein
MSHLQAEAMATCLLLLQGGGGCGTKIRHFKEFAAASVVVLCFSSFMRACVSAFFHVFDPSCVRANVL